MFDILHWGLTQYSREITLESSIHNQSGKSTAIFAFVRGAISWSKVMNNNLLRMHKKDIENKAHFFHESWGRIQDENGYALLFKFQID